MINRVLIRIRIVQILFAAQLNGTNDLNKIRNELFLGLESSYDLYFYLLQLPVVLTDEYANRVEAKKSKLLRSLESVVPNTRIIENKFLEQLRENKDLNEYLGKRPFDWYEHENFIKNILNTILESEVYKEYIAKDVTSYDDDKEFWRKVFKSIIVPNEELYALLEDESLFWNDDIDIIQSFVIKTIKKFDENKGINQPLLAMFKDDDDKEFAIKLLDNAYLNQKEYREIIDNYTQNWEAERIALMDLVIMQIAIAEILNFPTIPISVTLNEFIDISKSYSSAKSGGFINGILDVVVKKLIEEHKILKK